MGGVTKQAAAPIWEPTPSALRGKRIVLDCRWLGLGGAGRVTELVLADFRGSPPPGDWTLWGKPERLRQVLFDGAHVQPAIANPRVWRGQRDVGRVPSADVVVYMHQLRPLRPGTSVTVIHDTIGLRHGGTRATRFAKRLFLLAVARLSSHVITDSAVSAARIMSDLHVPESRITVVRFPQDPERARDRAGLRESLGQEDRLLYLGRFAPHKNLGRLCLAFRASRFSARGGTLWLVGGWEGETERMREWLRTHRIAGVEVRPTCSELEVDRLLATSRALVLPSLEEGFGLPAFEAAACGLPVAASRTGGMVELPPEAAVLFDPLDLDEMTIAIDEATTRPARAASTERDRVVGKLVVEAVAQALVAPSKRLLGMPARP